LLPGRSSTAVHRVPCPTPHSKKTGPLIARPVSWTSAGGPHLGVAPEVKGLQHFGPRGADEIRRLLAATAPSRVGSLSVSAICPPSREDRCEVLNARIVAKSLPGPCETGDRRQEEIAMAATTTLLIVVNREHGQFRKLGAEEADGSQSLAGVLKGALRGPVRKRSVMKSRAVCRPDVRLPQHAGAGRAVV